MTINAPRVWTIGLDPGRQLTQVDPENREALLSIGAFVENLVRAAEHDAGMTPQFILRVGYLDRYPKPVSLCRPVPWFVRT